MRTIYRSCTLCEAICGLEFKLEGDQITSIRGDKNDVLSRGHICPKGPEMKSIHNDPDRIKKPLRRKGETWEEISWEDALSEVAKNLHGIQKNHGNDAVAYYAGNPNVHNYGSLLFAPRFITRLKTRNYYSATSVDQLPHHFAALFMFGHPLLLPIPDIDRTDYFLIMGANPMASNGSIMTAPDIRGRLNAIRGRGGKVIVVDPRRTETAERADEHIFIRPGTDAYFLLSLLNVVFAKKLNDPGRLRAFTDGFDRLEKLVSEFTPEVTERITGVSKSVTEKIATEFANAKSAVCYGRVGLSTQAFGGLCHWLINALNLVTGNLDEPGGAMFTLPAVDMIGAEGKRDAYGSFGTYKSKSRGLPEFGGEIPVAALADEILFEGEGGIRALVTSAGNPVLSTPNGVKLGNALSSLKFMVSIDFYMNETTRYANIILPPTSPLEHDHYDIIFNIFSVRNTARYSVPIFDPPEGTMHDWEIFTELTERLENERQSEDQNAKSKSKSRTRIKPTDYLDRMLKSGPHSTKTKITLESLKANPHGIDLGPLTSVFPDRLKTKTQRIDLVPEKIAGDLDRLRKDLLQYTRQNGNSGRDSLLLIGRRSLRDNNSWMHNLPGLMSGQNRCTLQMHRSDADRLSLATGQQVRAKSRVGAVELPLEIVEDIMPGVVSIPHGYGHRKGGRLKVAAEHAGVSINDLTDESLIDELTGNAAFSGVHVEVSPAG